MRYPSFLSALSLCLLCLGIGVLSLGSQCQPLTRMAVPSASTDWSWSYDLEHPTRTIVLDDPALKEISGLSPTDRPGFFLCLADELGEAYLLDLAHSGTIRQRIPFFGKGDFEGIEMVGNTIWAIKSDGEVFEVTGWDQSGTTPVVTKYETPLRKEDDVEGLGYDPQRKVLLLACKGDPKTGAAREVWAFDPATRKLAEKPLFSLPARLTDPLVPPNDSDKDRAFSPSAIAVHPLTGEVYVLSSALKRLAVVHPETGQLLGAVRLDKNLLPQPEGIAFDATGTLYISSEGKKDAARVLQFDVLKK
jgi:uncharacterized protein YjiK